MEPCQAGLHPRAGRLAGLLCPQPPLPHSSSQCFEVFSPHSSTVEKVELDLGGHWRGRCWLGSGMCLASAIPQLEQLNRRREKPQV